MLVEKGANATNVTALTTGTFGTLVILAST